ncbi:PTS cellobiose transporter subunit IIC [Lactobacillus amylovorus DSM 20531]|uniref:PTS sugar transporter subunit IIC n=1 Tax=Lactobacillus amylovorus TaxID=1604 RepID=UPI0006EE6F6B|nr:PTS sugar transporter subunit IIC [Lactobacillus amylovorus]ATO53532.1 PTS cellobiose transporter subunit IIC [Lactobacillus amylovorus DSM 20531]KRK41879.1 cellobiose-specific PTS IIC [Lactobacillus amylovorus DSM 20531]MCT3592534.1 PTS sugar transporter subunit IIC [Lactobacillus amylovorus]
MADKKSGGLTVFVNKHIMPVAAKIGNFKPLIAVRDGIAMAMPLIIVGSLFMIINSFPAPGWSDWLAKTAVHGVSIEQILAKITNGSFGIMGLIAAFGIAWSYANQRKTDGVSAGIISASVFFILTPSIMSGDKVPVEGFPYTYLGSRGLFVAIIFGLITGWIFQWFINHNIQIKMPETVPPAVAKSFSALIPGAVVIAIAGCVYWLFTWAGWGNIHDVIMNILAKPLGALGDTLIGTLVSILLVSLFWFVGIHGGNVVNTAMSPIWLMQTDANRVLNQAGHLDLAHGGHIITQPFIDNFVYMGGGGATIGLVLCIGYLVWRKRASKQSEVLAPLTIVPGLFNINEPTMFGLPVVMNLMLIIPFILAPMINAITTYIAMNLGLVPLCNGTVITWTMPPLISGFLATGSIAGSILQLINIVLDVLIYMPFMSALNKRQLMEENRAK